jgi:hypothetical protein
VRCLKSNELRFNIFCVKKGPVMFLTPLTLCSLNRVSETVQMTKGSMLASPA